MSRKAIVITHTELGIYLGGLLGMGFWSCLDPAGQDHAVTFPSEFSAREYVKHWAENNDPDQYQYWTVQTLDTWATITEMAAAGIAPAMIEPLRAGAP